MSPTDSTNIDPGHVYGSTDGTHAVFHAEAGFSDAQESATIPYLSTRATDGWRTTAVSGATTTSATPPFYNNGQEVRGFADCSRPSATCSTADFTRLVFVTQDGLDPGDTNQAFDLYTREPEGTFFWDSPGVASSFQPQLAAISADATQVVISSIDGNLYETVNGEAPRLVNVRPDETTASNATVGSYEPGHPGGTAVHAMSADGKKVYFESDRAGARGTLWVRENGTTTRHIADNAIFDGASADGNQVFFDTQDALVPGDSGGNDLYEYDLRSATFTRLSDGVVADSAVVPASVVSADDGSIVYFVAQGQLTAGEGVAGGNNIYAWEDGDLKFVATSDENPLLSLGIIAGGGEAPNGALIPTVDVTPDGEHLAFLTTSQVTPDDTDTRADVYVYSAADNSLTLASVGPSGGDGSYDAVFSSAALDILTDRQPHFLTDDGDRVFFSTPEQLVSRDANDKVDVYERHIATDGTSLISTGAAGSDATLSTIDGSGENVFFADISALVPQDVNHETDVYDARAEGGFPAPPVPTPSCSGDGCQAQQSSVPPLPVAGSITFSEPGALLIARLRVLTRRARGPRFVLRVVVPDAGRVAVSGRGIKAVSRLVRHRGSYALRITLTHAATHHLTRYRVIKLRLRARFTAGGGHSSSVVARVTVKAPRRHARVAVARTASYQLGGAR